MVLLTGSVILDAITLITALLVLINIHFLYVYKHFERLGIPYEKCSIPFGSIGNPFTRNEHNNVTARRMYTKHKELGHRHFGFYVLNKPVYMPVDLDIIRCILTKDFEHFYNRGTYVNEKADPVEAHLVTLESTKWKDMRAKVTPAFSSGKMKMVFNTLVERSDEMLKFIEKKRLDSCAVDGRSVIGRYVTDVIGSCAFGLECNSFKEDAKDRKFERRIFAVSIVRRVFTYIFPKLSKILGVKVLSDTLSNFILNVVKDAVAYRENNNFYRKDFLQLLIEIKNKQNAEGGTFTMEQLAAQVYLFFAAGYETTATTLMFCLYELALHKEVQNKVREEIRSVLSHHGKLSYDSIQDMKYLAQVLDGKF